MNELRANSLSQPETENDTVLENPKLLLPFTLGWKREVVMRVITDNKKPNCDIYYFDPKGKKLRSTTEVKANLSNGLDIECFSFQKKILNVEGEIVRKAQVRGKASAKYQKPNSENKTMKMPRNKRKEVIKSKISDSSNFTASDTSFDLGRPRSKRQSMIRKKQQLKAIMNFKKTKQTRVVPEKKKPKKIDKKKAKDVDLREESKDFKNSNHNHSKKLKSNQEKNKQKEPRRKVKRKPKAKKPMQVIPFSERFKQEKLAEKLDISNEVADLKTIVQKNIVKYREMRKKEMMKKLGENKIEEKAESANRANSRHRSEPISENLEVYLKPLEKGWKRELVYRVNGAWPGGQSDVYYYHPNGRKFRSAREVAEHMTPGLTLDCFTFRKEPIGCGEPKEIIRNARANRKSVTAKKEKLILIKEKKK